MELTPFAWLLVVLALILGFLAGYFKFKPQVPPLMNSEPITTDPRKGNSITIPATGGSVKFSDQKGNEFQIQLPEQIPPREITFTNLEKFEPLLVDGKPNPKVPNPGNKRVGRIIIKLEATDANGPVEDFYPMMTTIWKYTPEDVQYARGDPKNLCRFYHNGKEWIELAMPQDAVNTSDQTVTAFVVSFSSCGGGDH